MNRFSHLMAMVAVLSCFASPAFAEVTEIELAQVAGTVSAAAMTVDVESKCVEGQPYFRVINAGLDWPQLVQLEIIRIADQKIIVQRNMRMKNGQNATFRLPTDRVGKGEFGIRLKPKWYDRQVDFDARVSCD